MGTKYLKISFDDIYQETKKAVHYEIDGKKYWIPISQIKDVYLIGKFLVLPEWLVESKGLEQYVW